MIYFIIAGKEFEPDLYRERLNISPKCSHHFGDHLAGGRIVDTNYLFVKVYEDHFQDLHSEISVVEDYLRQYQDEFQELSELKEVEIIKLVINLNSRLHGQLASQGEFLSAEFIQLLAKFRICIALNIWDLPEWHPPEKKQDDETAN